MTALNYGSGFNLRDATSGDAKEVHGLSCQLAAAIGDARPGYEAVAGRLSGLVTNPSARVVVAEDGEGIKGVVTLWVKPDLAHGDTVVEVPTLVVDEGCRGRGVGKLLMRRVREIAAGHGASLIELVATRDNSSARAFYRSLGFVETDHVALELVGGA